MIALEDVRAARDISRDQGGSLGGNDGPERAAPRLGVERGGSLTLVKARGALDMFNKDHLKNTLQAALAGGPATLVLDLQAVTFLSGGALWVLVDCATRAREQDIAVLILPSPAVTHSAEALGVTHLLGLDPSDSFGE